MKRGASGTFAESEQMVGLSVRFSRMTDSTAVLKIGVSPANYIFTGCL